MLVSISSPDSFLTECSKQQFGLDPVLLPQTTIGLDP